MAGLVGGIAGLALARPAPGRAAAGPRSPVARLGGIALEVPPIVPRSAWGARAPSGPYQSHDPAWLTIHHTAARWTGGNTAAHLRVIQDFHQGPDRRWVDVAYHFLIDRDGTAYAGRPVWAAPDTATEYNPFGHLTICLLGDFDTQPAVPDQIEGAIAVGAWLLSTHALPIDRLWGHGDWAATSCPGRAIARLLADQSFAERIADRLEG